MKTELACSFTFRKKVIPLVNALILVLFVAKQTHIRRHWWTILKVLIFPLTISVIIVTKPSGLRIQRRFTFQEIIEKCMCIEIQIIKMYFRIWRKFWSPGLHYKSERFWKRPIFLYSLWKGEQSKGKPSQTCRKCSLS